MQAEKRAVEYLRGVDATKARIKQVRGYTAQTKLLVDGQVELRVLAKEGARGPPDQVAALVFDGENYVVVDDPEKKHAVFHGTL